MNLNPQIKIKLLRDVKTDALLIYIKTVIEELLENIKNETYKIDLGYEKFNKEIEENIYKLNSALTNKTINAYELKAFASYEQIKHKNNKLYHNALVFFNSLVRQIETKLVEGDIWIPEQIVLSLLSEWILEENKSTSYYTFLKDFDYLNFSYYESVRNNEKHFKRKYNSMYKILLYDKKN
ncbi:MAG: hypothetical protein U5K55_01645 [Aliarcobacter sp.]|nr:hypothetical protein [Aliarcobacter sp.]